MKPPVGVEFPELPAATTNNDPFDTAVRAAERSLEVNVDPPKLRLIMLAPCCDAQTIPPSILPGQEPVVGSQTRTGKIQASLARPVVRPAAIPATWVPCVTVGQTESSPPSLLSAVAHSVLEKPAKQVPGR